MKDRIFLDSRFALGQIPSTCGFPLNHQIVNAKQVKVMSFSFANTLYNVSSLNNTLVFNLLTVTLPPAFYSFSAFVTAINTALLANGPFVAAMGGAPNAVVLNTDNTASWTIGTNTLQGGTLYPNLVLAAGNSYTGNFVTNLFLACPQAIQLESSSLQGSDSRYSACNASISNPFAIFVIESAFGQMESVGQSNQLLESTQLSNSNISRLDVVLRDASTLRELSEISHWCCLLEIFS